MKRTFAAYLALACALNGATAESATIKAVSWQGNVYNIDDATGATTLVGSTGFSDLNSLAQNSAGVLYTAASSQLITINPLTGAGTAGPSLGVLGAGTSIRGLAFSGSDTLYAINNGGGSGSVTGIDELYTINVATGTSTLIGLTGFVGLQGLDFSASGELFAWDTSSDSLVELNLATAAGTLVGSSGDSFIQSIAFRSDGTLFGVDGTLADHTAGLYSINSANGATTFIGATGPDIRGIEFVSAIPEPSSIALLMVGLGISACTWGRRQRGR